jgi:rRNA maturation RNase YbeY
VKGDARRHRNAVEVANRQRRIPVNLGRYRRLLTRLVSATGRGPAVVGLTFVNDRQMHRLNRRYRRQNRPTDVLAFPSVRPPALGDIVISVDTARRQADGRLTDECRRLLIHGYLHLLGYDHERSPREARRMHRMERRLERRLA